MTDQKIDPLPYYPFNQYDWVCDKGIEESIQ